MNILVVDDEGAFRMLLRNYLKTEGWNVVTADNGEEALAKMAREKIDLIVSDVYMPVMDGIRLHKAVRETAGYETVPFLFVSAYDDQHTLGAVKDPKLEGFMKKGRPPNELKEWILYLVTPEEKRPRFPPGQGPKGGPEDRYRKKS